MRQARQIVTKLLVGRLTFVPERQNGRQGFRFQATGTVDKLLARVVPGALSTLQTVASPRGIVEGCNVRFTALAA